ncbi:MAG: MFS transporter [Gemmatimonadaceae bacterium]
MPTPHVLDRIGLHRPELRAWALYDWAISSVQTTIMTAIYPIYFAKVVAAALSERGALQLHANANVIAMVIIAVLAPILGALADYAAAKKRLLGVFMGLGVAASASMFFLQGGDITFAVVLFILSMIGAAGSMSFYESLLPHIARPDEVDRVSSAGYALGYAGGGILLALNIAWVLKPALFGLPSGDNLTEAQRTLPTRLAFLSVAVWWLLFSIPLFRRVPEPPRALEADERGGENPVKASFVRLGETLRELRGYKNAFLMLLAFMIYNDGIATIQKMATMYGTEIGIPDQVLITAILIVQFVGIPCAFLFGMLAGKIGAKRAVFLGIFTYCGISILGYFMRTPMHFYLLAGLVGLVQGGTQALSRSLFANMIPQHKSGEFFGFYSVFEKFAGILGPLVFSLAITLGGSGRNGILSIIVFFIIGGILLTFVNVEEGERTARAAEKGVRIVEPGTVAA